jgi:hypothetical protein
LPLAAGLLQACARGAAAAAAAAVSKHTCY